MEGNWDSPIYAFLQVTFTTCNNLTSNVTCESQEVI